MIDWDFIKDSYNNIKGTNFRNDKEMLIAVHKKIGSLRGMEDALGVSWVTIASRMDYHDISRRKIMKNGELSSKIATIPDKELLTMTSKEIANRVGCSHDWAMRNLARQGRKYNRRFKYYNKQQEGKE